ncbi:MAG: hypothetical protein WA982_15325 [Rubrobacteraceae bacterium]
MERQLGLVVESGVSFVVVGFFLAGVVGVFLVMVFFVNGSLYRRSPKPLTNAEFEVARREVGRWLSDLAPRTILLAERLRDVDETLAEGGLDDGRWVKVERLTREAPAAGVWRRYSTATALAEEQPLVALEELREVEWMVETALSKLGEAQRLCNVEERA